MKNNRNIRTVILVPDYKVEYFRNNFAAANVVVEGVRPNQASKTLRGLFFKRLAVFLFDSDTTRIKRRYLLYHYKDWLRFVSFSLAAIFGHSLLIRRIVRFFDFHLSPKGFFRPLISKYEPALVFSTDIQNENDVSLMHDARLSGIPIFGMVRSWDNMTQRTCRIFPDRLIAGSEAVKDEVLKFHRYPKERVSIVGNPHYDRYLKAPISSRKEFFGRLGLNPDRPLIFYNPIGDPIIHKNDTDTYIMKILGTLDAQVLVRLPTNLPVNLDNFIKPANMVIDRPGFNFRPGDIRGQEISRADDDRLIDSLYYSDVIVSGPSSICLDAALLDKPVIAVDFYPTERHLFEAVYAYQYEHLKKLLATQGVYRAQNKDDFLQQIKKYISNPDIHKEGRAKIRALWFSHADGKASKRLVKELLAL